MSFYNTPKFFKIIQNHELQNGSQLWIPKKFVEKYWKAIPNPVVIRLPNGVQQKLFWEKRDGDIWFNKNWNKISKFLKFGYLVVFKYIGGPCFHLEIFGIDCLEIDYSKINLRDEPEFVTKSQKTKFGKRKIELEFDSSSDDEFVDVTNIASTSQTRKNAVNRRSMKKKATKCSTRKKTYATGGSPSFKLKLTHTYATGYLFRVPCDFSREYLKDFEGSMIIRRIGEDRNWVVGVKYDSKGGYSIVSSGWRTFCDRYNLQIGDVCKFKMIRSEPLFFTVSIIRARE